MHLVEAAVRRFAAPSLPSPGERVALDAAASHHLLNVCRHPRGARLVLFDGGGREVDAVLVDVDGVAVAEAIGATRVAAPRHALHLVLALAKGGALDEALRMAVETGATDVHPAISARTVPRGDRAERWQRILASAAAQCGRADVPRLHPLRPLTGAADAVPSRADRRVAVPGAERSAPAAGDAAVAVGPEGGFAPAEIDALLARGWRAVGLGPWVLRVDTAVAVALASTTP